MTRATAAAAQFPTAGNRETYLLPCLIGIQGTPPLLLSRQDDDGLAAASVTSGTWREISREMLSPEENILS
jgi:hypothetical protein